MDQLSVTTTASSLASVASFARSFTLPVEVDQAESSARMEHGVLTLQLAKRGAVRATQLTVN